jgi:hypothetical protein
MSALGRSGALLWYCPHLGEPSVTNVKRYIQFHLLEPWMIT